MIVLLLIIFLALPLCLAHQHVAEFAHPGALAVAMETGFTADPVRNHGNRTLVRLRGRGDWRVARKHAMWIETQVIGF